MSAVIVGCEDPLGFLTEAAKDPRFKDGDLALRTRIILNQRGAKELEELGPEKMIRAKLQRLELLGYCVHDKTLSRRFQVGGKSPRAEKQTGLHSWTNHKECGKEDRRLTRFKTHTGGGYARKVLFQRVSR